MNYVLDTDVIIAAFRSKRGASYQVFGQAIDKTITALLSVPLLVEYEAVLKRPYHQEEMNLTIAEIDIVLNMIASKFTLVERYYKWRPFLSDTSDAMVLETATNGKARAIITFNHKHFQNVKEKFGIEILKPSDLLERSRL